MAPPDPTTPAQPDEELPCFRLLQGLMDQLDQDATVPDLVRNLVRHLAATLDGPRVRLWYRWDDHLICVDDQGNETRLDDYDHPLARQVASLGVASESPGARGGARAFPLRLGQDTLGVALLEDLGEPAPNLDRYLPLYFAHVGLVLGMQLRNAARQDAEEALGRATERLRAATEAGIIGIWDWDIVADQLVWDASMYRLYGLRDGGFGGAYQSWANAVHPDDRAFVEGEIRAALAGEREYAPEFRVIWPDGSVHHIKAASRTLRDGAGQPLRMVGINYDLTDRKRAEEELARLNRELVAIGDCHQTLMRADDEFTLLSDICRIVCDQAGYRMAWVGYPEDDETRQVRPVAWAGMEAGYLAEARITWHDEPRGQGPAGTAIRSGASVCVQDFLADPRTAPWHRRASELGFLACLALPLRTAHGPVFAVLCIYAGQTHAFTPQEIRLLEQLAADLAFGITVLRGRTELARAEEERREHLEFLVNLDRINRSIQSAAQLKTMMADTLDQVLEIYQCDRAYLLYPCDPAARAWHLPMERTRPEYPGALILDNEVAMDAGVADSFRRMLTADGPVRFGPGTPNPLPVEVSRRFGFKSLLTMAIRPKTGKTWQFGIHQCSHAREWTDREVRLFEEIGRRLGDALTSLLTLEELRESERRLKDAERIAHVGYWERDLVANTIKMSEETYRIFGLDPGQPYDDLTQWHARWQQLVHPDDLPRVRRVLDEALAGGPPYNVDYRVARPDGTIRVVQSRAIIPMDESGRPTHILGTLQDITERRQVEDRLRLAASVFAHSQEGIIITDAQRRILDVNDTFTSLTGYLKEEAVGRTPGMLSSGQHDKAFYDRMWQELNEKSAWKGEIWNRRKNGQLFPELLHIDTVRDSTGQVTNYVGVFSDISRQKQHQSELERVAHYDTLTGLPNRRLLADRLEQALARALRGGQALALCYLDLDGFKAVNDRYGHAFGDRVLMEVTARLKSECRADDTISRLGGDEFVLLFNEAGDQSTVSRMLDRILQRLAAPIQLDQYLVNVSASIGVTLCPMDGRDADQLLRQADRAMYLAKESGKNRYVFYDSEQDRLALALREGQQRVYLALREGEFVLHYQPKISLLDGSPIGAEALLRWHHPERGLLSPGEFLHYLEGTDLSAPLGEWVIDAALEQIGRWNASGLHLTVSVNISPDHLQSPDFAHTLKTLLERHPEVAPRQLELEILESSAIDDLENASRTLSACLGLGVRFSLDDFGTGYSSLAYFRRLPVETLKIDQAFVRDMLDDPEDLGIVESVIRLAQAFNRPVIAEGVESLEHGAMLVHLGCHFGQGYGIARPMPADRLDDWVRQWDADSAWHGLGAATTRLDDVVLLVAGASHRKWVDCLANYILDEDGACPQNLHSSQCRFGRWYRGSGAARYGHLPEFANLDDSHESIHALASQLVTLAANGQREEARKRMPELYAARDRVLQGLDDLTRRIGA